MLFLSSIEITADGVATGGRSNKQSNDQKTQTHHHVTASGPTCLFVIFPLRHLSQFKFTPFFLLSFFFILKQKKKKTIDAFSYLKKNLIPSAVCYFEYYKINNHQSYSAQTFTRFFCCCVIDTFRVCAATKSSREVGKKLFEIHILCALKTLDASFILK